jgi:hypothetical protein
MVNTYLEQLKSHLKQEVIQIKIPTVDFREPEFSSYKRSEHKSPRFAILSFYPKTIEDFKPYFIKLKPGEKIEAKYFFLYSSEDINGANGDKMIRIKGFFY